jgi:formylglycine-generating enzyme required for sulfatase activity
MSTPKRFTTFPTPRFAAKAPPPSRLAATARLRPAQTAGRVVARLLLAAWVVAACGRPAVADEKELFAGTFAAGALAKPWKTIGGTWRVQQGVLKQVDAGLDDPSKAVLVAGDAEEMASGIVVTAKLRLDTWKGDDQARAGVGVCCDPENGYGLNLAFNRGQLQFVHDYVAWAPGCAFSYKTGTWYWMKLCKTAGALRGKAWRDGEPEPVDWMVSWTGFDDSLTGYPALMGSSGGPGADGTTVSFAQCRVTRVGPSAAAYYAKRATWHDTMAASLDALARLEAPAAAASDRKTADARRESLWRRLRRDFPDPQWRRQMAWERQDGVWPQTGPSGTVAAIAARYAGATRAGLAEEARRLAGAVKTPADLESLRRLYYRSQEIEEAVARWDDAKILSLRLAIEDLWRTFPAQYAKGPEYLRRLAEIETALAASRTGPGNAHSSATGVASRAAQPRSPERFHAAAQQFQTLRTEALLANPLMGFDRLVLVKRADAGQKTPRPKIRGEAGNFVGNDAVGFLNGLPINFQGNAYLREIVFDNEIAVLSPVRPDGRLTTLYRPEKPVFVGDVKMHFDADRLLFSSVGSHDRWQIFEVGVDGSRVRQVTRGEENDVDNYDSCYLADDRILFASSACFQSVPCERRCDEVANFCVINADGSAMRRLCFDQDHNFYPSMMIDGRILYTRWEYTDIAHAFTGRLMTMNPDGTGQRAHYGSGSFWPNRIFYARPIPKCPTKFVAIVTGHHGTARAGELVVFDVAKGRRQAEGAVQRIPGRGKTVEAKMVDNLVDASWPKFLHPYPLSDKYFLAACQPNPQSHWGIYLVDVFDNMLLLREEDGCVLFEPAPVQKTPRPPVMPDRVNLASREGTVYLKDIYIGSGLKGVPRGAVKKLRLFTYHFNYYGTSGIEDYVGMDGPWDVRRVLGTAPVSADGSAYFTVPANTPIAVQPLDAEGKAVQLMRSWFTAMPGEAVTCVGCHEHANNAPPQLAAGGPGGLPARIEPWRGPVRGFSWDREVQPALDKYCVGCHDGRPQAGGAVAIDLRRAEPKSMPLSPFPFPPSFYELRRLVRSPGLEGPSVIPVADYHADANPLVQMLRKGHHNVRLDDEAWDRLITWIDMNAPAYGTWLEIPTVRNRQQYLKRPTEYFSAWLRPSPIDEIQNFRRRRIDMQRRYGGVDEDPEVIPALPSEPVRAEMPPPEEPPTQTPALAGWPFDAVEAQRRQSAAAGPTRLEIELGAGVKMDMVRIPAGEFVLGDPVGYPDERPRGSVKIQRPFWIGACEVTNEQFHQFRSSHDSGSEPMLWLKWHPGHFAALDQPRQPVARVSWLEARAFCDWLSQKTGKRFSLPDEAQWEWACRAGGDAPWNFGASAAEFPAFANLADTSLLDLGRLGALEKVKPFFAVETGNDKQVVAAPVGSYRPNAWGLFDMHGNVGEWTASAHLPYPFRADDPRHAAADTRKVVRGGSWRERADLARSACRTSYQPWQRVFNVGFRVVCQ